MACAEAGAVYAGRVKTHRWFALCLLAMAMATISRAQVAPTFSRPGSMIVVDVVGEPTVVVGGEEKPLKLEDRLRAELTFKTTRRSTVAVEFSNGALLKLGSDSEVAVEEFYQQPHSQPGKVAEWKEEPSPSRTLLRLVRGDLTVNVKPLKLARGSSFTLELIAGTLRIREGAVSARVQMTELGIGLCTLRLESGAAEFEPVGGKPMPVAAGKRLELAVEVAARNGAVKVGPAPVEGATAPKK